MTIKEFIDNTTSFKYPENWIGMQVYFADSKVELRENIISFCTTGKLRSVTTKYKENTEYIYSVNGKEWQYVIPVDLVNLWRRGVYDKPKHIDTIITMKYGHGCKVAEDWKKETLDLGFLSAWEITCLDILRPGELTIKLAKEKNMNAVAVNYWNDQTGRFEGKKYTYLVEGEYKEGDYLVFRNYDGHMVTVKVAAFITDLDTLDSGINYKEMVVLGIADMSPYQAIIDKEEKEARKEEIMSELEFKFEEANKMALYKELAKEDKDMADLLKELNSLDS